MTLSKQIEAHYDQQAEKIELTKVKDLYKVGDKVRIKKQPSKGSNKFNQMPYSKEIYEIKEVRNPTRSYVLELNKENRQPLRFFCHHRRCKQIFERPEKLRDINIKDVNLRPMVDQNDNNGQLVPQANQQYNSNHSPTAEQDSSVNIAPKAKQDSNVNLSPKANQGSDVNIAPKAKHDSSKHLGPQATKVGSKQGKNFTSSKNLAPVSSRTKCGRNIKIPQRFLD